MAKVVGARARGAVTLGSGHAWAAQPGHDAALYAGCLQPVPKHL